VTPRNHVFLHIRFLTMIFGDDDSYMKILLQMANCMEIYTTL
jgi:hypothetical protein